MMRVTPSLHAMRVTWTSICYAHTSRASMKQKVEAYRREDRSAATDTELLKDTAEM